jgi:glycosyltransferase involved in cell wall biosynthesis
LNEAQGLGALIDAFIQLKQEPALKKLRFRATGGCTTADQVFVDAVREKLRRHGVEDSVEFLADFRKSHGRAFLRSLSVLSAPAPQGEAFGVQLIEAMALGVPVVQPAVGAYPEIIEATGGGILYDPDERSGLVDALRSVLLNPEHARLLGQRGRAAVRERFTMDRVVRDMAKVYASVLEFDAK